MKITIAELRKIIRESVYKNKKYWGRGGAGILFKCSEDDTILLLLRAGWVQQGGTWGIPGGGIGEGFNNTPIEDPIPLSSPLFLKTAKREVQEECGSLPSKYSIVGKTVFEDGGFRYVTYIADVPLTAKKQWKMSSGDGETDDFRWFPSSEVRAGGTLDGAPLHFGVEYTLAHS